MRILFISDLHLSEQHPEITDCFLDFMANEAPKADQLYVLGDLFEYWIGDDNLTPFNQTIINAFKTLTDTGTSCFFIHGNRDFLVGKQFSQQTNVTLLPEEAVIDINGQKAVILHGDTLCTEDVSYQQYRKKVHNPVIQWIFRHLPLSYRRKIAAKIRNQSSDDNQTKSNQIMDVTFSEVESILNKYQVNLMIHGHTHRPNIHEINVNNQQKSRIVLGDWYTQGSVLICDNDKISLETITFNC
ncbi:UDP-2,3-diacylglucosamine diphosphatase [Vibrio sp. SS-MA-C1-2]|uniref:UDP-2,3-diacylglucosamine diphosphatase n=1 Tax=Vibrio sp. SS-MA-C1-2 TaxID=2908646 RepID=UPI001F36180B|nr:UDP-2,3-diacylglucosamine diphosphatase [Vibrio sp. SS-MA-C1-2]UJF18763.1 UDP-2,3-diacylglucosamine diphosphatase [Vibrio sp. SS-MA-C1-2]